MRHLDAGADQDEIQLDARVARRERVQSSVLALRSPEARMNR